VFDLLPSDQRFNHRVTVEGGCLEELAADKIRTFFRARREAGKLDDTAS
jgi:tRNA(adenine34) deaminase